jgi:hypothetical protein
MTDDEIRKRVRERLANRTLPRELPGGVAPLTADQPLSSPQPVIFGSPSPDPCVVCDEPGTQLRYDLPTGTGSLAFHHRCRQIWEEERHRPIRRDP